MKSSETFSNGTMFFFLGFSDLSLTAQTSLFIFFLLSYLLSWIGNGLIILAVTLSPPLHSPMYFFLRILSFNELLTISSTVPKALQSFFWSRRSISFIGCTTQLFIFAVAAACECTLLTVMAFDRYMAICHPLRYMSVMTVRLCYQLTLCISVFAISHAIIECFLIFTLSYCRTLKCVGTDRKLSRPGRNHTLILKKREAFWIHKLQTLEPRAHQKKEEDLINFLAGATSLPGIFVSQECEGDMLDSPERTCYWIELKS
ncbi:olfactory receptor 2H1-like [Leptodactylus fuscus]|uniref:olfactory receptor 2H1-like n=1 Tax=Leptodactylus fuscus TaxID=238119 RepID=UPI003F4E51A4